MQVICISSLVENVIDRKNTPQVGSIYTVDETKEHFYWGLYYHILEFEGDLWWNADKFSPLSDIDELELVNEKEYSI